MSIHNNESILMYNGGIFGLIKNKAFENSAVAYTYFLCPDE